MQKKGIFVFIFLLILISPIVYSFSIMDFLKKFDLFNNEENIFSGSAAYGACKNECVSKTKQCSGNGYKICGDYDSDSCLEWSPVALCAQDQICSDGICSSSNADLPEIKCLDNTNNNQCSANKPQFCDSGILVNKCDICGCSNNGECLQDGSCISVPNGSESSDPNLLNNAPVFSFLRELMLYENQLNLDKLINLNEYAADLDNDKLDFYFENNKKIFNSDIINCFIREGFFGCNQPKKQGKLIILIYADDGAKKTSSQISIQAIQKNLLKKTGVVGAKGSENKAPIADAGSDKTVITGSAVILDGSKSYDEENNLPDLPSNYIWHEESSEIGKGINLKKIFPPGTHKIVLQVIDSEGLSSTDSVLISVKSKSTCRDTNAAYVPEDTICNKKWPSKEGELLTINSQDYSCNLVEVCNEDLDIMIEESINCCSGTPLLTDQSRTNACNFANKYSGKNTKKCQALYLIQALGGDSIYMKDYFEVEMCCKGVSELCSNEKNLYSSRPLPKTGKDLSQLRCINDPKNNPPGEWISDSKIGLNNIALQDVPAHVSLNVLSSGTCVDYGFSLLTLFRKAGYKKDEAYLVEAPNHAYNLIKLPLDKKYTLVDTTGNNNPAIIFGKAPLGYKYCESIQKCYNDNGEALCPGLEEIYGCENIKQNLAQKTNVVGFKVNEAINKFTELIKTELKR